MITAMLYFGCLVTFLLIGSTAHQINTERNTDDETRACLVLVIMVLTIVLTILFSKAIGMAM